MEMDKVYVDENMVISTFLDKPDFFRIDDGEFIHIVNLRDIDFLSRHYNMPDGNIDEMIEILKVDFNKRKSWFYIPGKERKDLMYLLSTVDIRVEYEQLVRLVVNGAFDIKDVVEYIEKKYTKRYFNIEEQLNLIMKYDKDAEITRFRERIHRDKYSFIDEDLFLGLGSGRAVFSINDEYVMKIHLTSKGFEQSATELKIYNCASKDMKVRLDEPILVLKEAAIFKRYKPYGNLSPKGIDEVLSGVKLEEIMSMSTLLNNEFLLNKADLTDINNIGEDLEGNWLYLDYGATEDIIDEIRHDYSFKADAFDNILDSVEKGNIVWENYREYIGMYI